jgi:E3 ubiquitin-protein ligase NEDD4
VINVQVGNVFDTEIGGDEMLTLDLKKSNNHDTIQGKLILNLSTNINAPIRNGTNTLASGSSSIQNISSTNSTQPQPYSEASISNNNNNNNTATDQDNNDLPEG